MNTFGGFELRQVHLSLPRRRREWVELLEAADLKPVDSDYTAGVYDSDERLVATATLSGELMTGVAVAEDCRNESFTATLATEILSRAHDREISNLKVFTKPQYAPIFESLGFRLIGKGDRAVFLEHDTQSLDRYKKHLATLAEGADNVGVIVMNANPLTKGHEYLVRKAAGEVDRLIVIPLAEEKHNRFRYDERRGMIERLCAGIPNVRVAEGSHYVISRNTFPSYFIKEMDEAAMAGMRLDLDIFVRHIAPALGAKVRFVGSEPSDPLTAAYNAMMLETLPAQGIEVNVAERCLEGGEPVSASKVRGFMDADEFGKALNLAADASRPWILGHAAAAALRHELDLTPKPGLVDRNNSGSHKDMDYALMLESIGALRPVFTEMALHAGDIEAVRRIGVEGERKMLEATGGVNTHRGALFSMGLAVTAASRLLERGDQLSPGTLRSEIKAIAAQMPGDANSHGAKVKARFGIPTALDYAREGYEPVFGMIEERDSSRALLRLMSMLEDSNIYYRCGAEMAAMVKEEARKALESNAREKEIEAMDRRFVAENISPGGAADMLALLQFIRSII